MFSLRRNVYQVPRVARALPLRAIRGLATATENKKDIPTQLDADGKYRKWDPVRDEDEASRAELFTASAAPIKSHIPGGASSEPTGFNSAEHKQIDRYTSAGETGTGYMGEGSGGGNKKGPGGKKQGWTPLGVAAAAATAAVGVYMATSIFGGSHVYQHAAIEDQRRPNRAFGGGQSQLDQQLAYPSMPSSQYPGGKSPQINMDAKAASAPAPAPLPKDTKVDVAWSDSIFATQMNNSMQTVKLQPVRQAGEPRIPTAEASAYGEVAKARAKADEANRTTAPVDMQLAKAQIRHAADKPYDPRPIARGAGSGTTDLGPDTQKPFDPELHPEVPEKQETNDGTHYNPAGIWEARRDQLEHAWDFDEFDNASAGAGAGALGQAAQAGKAKADKTEAREERISWFRGAQAQVAEAAQDRKEDRPSWFTGAKEKGADKDAKQDGKWFSGAAGERNADAKDASKSKDKDAKKAEGPVVPMGEKKKEVAENAEAAKQSAESWFGEKKEQAKAKGQELKEDAKDASSRASAWISEKAGQAKDKATELKDSAKDKAAELKDKASELKDSAKDKAAELKDKASDKAAELKAGAKDKAQEAKDKASELKDSAKDKMSDALGTSEAAKAKERQDAKERADYVARFAKEQARVAQEQADEMAKRAKDAKQEAKQDAQQKAELFARAAKQQAKRAQDAADTARDRAKEAAGGSGAMAWLGEKKEQAKDKASEAKDSITDAAESAGDKVEGWFDQAKTKAQELASSAKSKLSGKDDTKEQESYLPELQGEQMARGIKGLPQAIIATDSATFATGAPRGEDGEHYLPELTDGQWTRGLRQMPAAVSLDDLAKSKEVALGTTGAAPSGGGEGAHLPELTDAQWTRGLMGMAQQGSERASAKLNQGKPSTDKETSDQSGSGQYLPELTDAQWSRGLANLGKKDEGEKKQSAPAPAPSDKSDDGQYLPELTDGQWSRGLMNLGKKDESKLSNDDKKAAALAANAQGEDGQYLPELTDGQWSRGLMNLGKKDESKLSSDFKKAATAQGEDGQYLPELTDAQWTRGLQSFGKKQAESASDSIDSGIRDLKSASRQSSNMWQDTKQKAGEVWQRETTPLPQEAHDRRPEEERNLPGLNAERLLHIAPPTQASLPQEEAPAPAPARDSFAIAPETRTADEEVSLLL